MAADQNSTSAACSMPSQRPRLFSCEAQGQMDIASQRMIAAEKRLHGGAGSAEAIIRACLEPVGNDNTSEAFE